MPKSSTNAHKMKKEKKNAPSDPIARSQRVPSLLPNEKFREFGRDEVVYG
jgi:hypothetical protein